MIIILNLDAGGRVTDKPMITIPSLKINHRNHKTEFKTIKHLFWFSLTDLFIISFMY